MFYERNLSRKYLVLCAFTFPGGHGELNHSGFMISVDSSKDIEQEFEEVAHGLNFRRAKLISFLPIDNHLFQMKQIKEQKLEF